MTRPIQPAAAGGEPRHPMQPIVMVRDVARFKKNAIVSFLLEAGPFDMNMLARMPWTDEDREQFAMLIGYSVSGAGDLSYFSDEIYAEAQAAVTALFATKVTP